MSADRLSTAAEFATGQVTWRCWITDDGQRLEWRSTCGRYRAGRDLKKADPAAFPPGKCPTYVAVYWCRAGDRVVGSNFTTLRKSMEAAIAARASA